MSAATPGNAEFPSTQWSLIAAAAATKDEQSAAALADLCSRYWYPVYAFIRRRGARAEDAADLTQEFFATLLEKDYLEDVDPLRGRFRSFLLIAVARFVSKQRDKAAAQKRGGGRQILSLDLQEGERRYTREPIHDWTPERVFDRKWAVTVLDQTLASLREEHDATGKGEQFERLKVYLTGDAGALPLAQLAEQLGTTEGAVKVAIHRLRQKYRDRLRKLVAQTVAKPDDVEDELRQLLAALRSN
jgi:RNA polymerase sigma-70 factor (ECF subfamily)